MVGRQHNQHSPLSRSSSIYSSRPWTASTGRSALTKVSSPTFMRKKKDKLPQPTISPRLLVGRRRQKFGYRHAIVESTGEDDTNLTPSWHSSNAGNSKSVDSMKEKSDSVEKPISTNLDDAPTTNTAKPETNGIIVKNQSSSPTTTANQTFSSKFRNAFCLSKCKSIKVADFSTQITLADSAPETDNKNESLKSPDTSDTVEKSQSLKQLIKTLVFDRTASKFYFWLAAVSVTYVYNLTIVIVRSVFKDLNLGSLWVVWLVFDIIADTFYLIDMFIQSRTGFLDQGLLVRDVKRITKTYLKNSQFKWDVASLFPLDYVFSIITKRPQPIWRLNRLLRKERIQTFMEQTETRSSLPNAFRVNCVVWYIAIIIHWNACLYFLISETVGLGSDAWVYGVKNTQSLPPGVVDTLARRYVYSFYWSTLILTTIGEVPGPQKNVEFVFVTLDLMCGVLIFATIVGNVGSMISNMSAARTDFQTKMDGIKQFMELRKVGKPLEVRVIKWFDYLWDNKQTLSNQKVLEALPDKLQAEIAMHVHFETLRKVRIFQDCEAGLLAELVLKLKLQVFSPGDFICRKGDIGREMYIVKRGKLQVVGADGITVYATLIEGAVFGELSILNIAGSKNGNRRTANVKSVGYTDLFVLNKLDLWTALREYPEARKMLIQKGREILRKDNLLDENAPEETKTAEDLADELQTNVKKMQQKIARLIAEKVSTDFKLKKRIAFLETKLLKYEQIGVSNSSEDLTDEEYQSNDAPLLGNKP